MLNLFKFKFEIKNKILSEDLNLEIKSEGRL